MIHFFHPVPQYEVFKVSVSVINKFMKAKLRWFGNVDRMDEEIWHASV